MFHLIVGTYKACFFIAILIKILSFVHKSLGVKLNLSILEVKAAQKVQVGDREMLVATQVHDDTTQEQVKRVWFSLHDLSVRLALTLLSFYYGMFIKPAAFLKYTFIFNKIHNGMVWAVIASISLPFWPLVCLVKAGACCLTQGNLHFLSMMDVNDEELESLQFFTNRLSPFVSFLYDYIQEFSTYAANFYILGPSTEGLQTMYWDTDKTSKFFWREELRKSGAAVPRQLGFWDGKVGELSGPVLQHLPGALVVKVVNSCMGIGDKFLKKHVDYNSQEDLVALFGEKYAAKECLVLELVKPLPSLGVHSLDILTAKDCNDCVQLIDVIVWAGSKTSSSHGASDAYMVDPVTGIAIEYSKWYNPNFLATRAAGLGVEYPGVAEAVLIALEAHRHIPYPWLPIVGWDAMVAEDGSIVFFEGNLAAWRCPRRLFLSFKNFVYFLKYISWVGR